MNNAINYQGTNNNNLTIFENYNIRRIYDKETDTWFFSIIDIIRILTQSDYQVARKYWNKLKERLNKEGSQSVTNCHQLKMVAEDGKMRLTDVASVETLLRLISFCSLSADLEIKSNDKRNLQNLG